MHNEQPAQQYQLEVSPTLARIRRLQNEREYRDLHGLFFIEGVRNFVQTVDNHFSIHTLAYSEKLLINPVARKLVRGLKRGGTPFARLTPEQFRFISKAEHASGIAAIVQHRIRNLIEIEPEDCQCWTALSRVRSPGNFGTLIRTSAATGATGFILLGDSIDPYDPSVVRATMGALFKQSLARTTVEELRRWAVRRHVNILGASPDGSMDYDRINYKRPTVLVLGTERSGLTKQEREICHRIVRIPMVDGVDSLNLSVAGSLMLYQVFRTSPG
ncbi:MAG TPA: RNA methyltransferase [Blastocatellia bacterium]|nr:RNA methyltransferase [Blastocatellia bacterium]